MKRSSQKLGFEISEAQKLQRILKWTIHGGELNTFTEPASDRLVDLAIRNGCGAFLFKFCDAGGLTGVTEIQEDRLLQYHASVWAQNIAYLSLANKIQNLLNEADRPAYFIKGVELLLSGLYSPGDRPMSDIDMLVRTHGFASNFLKMLAEKSGNTSLGHGFAGRFTRLSREDGAVLRDGRGNPVMLEMHYPQAPAFLPLPQLICRNAPVLFGRLKSKCEPGDQNRLPEEFHLLLLGVHLIQHHLGSKLLWYYDIARLIHEHSDLNGWNWDFILREIRHLQMEGVFQGLFWMIERDFAVRIPSEVVLELGGKLGMNKGIIKAMFHASNTVGDRFCGAKIWNQSGFSFAMARRQVYYILFHYLFSDHATFFYKGGCKRIFQTGQSAIVMMFGKPLPRRIEWLGYLVGLPVALLFMGLSLPIKFIHKVRENGGQCES